MNELKRIAVNNAGQVFFYQGKILRDSDNFILFKDQKEGILEINKGMIIYIKHLGGVYNG